MTGATFTSAIAAIEAEAAARAAAEISLAETLAFEAQMRSDLVDFEVFRRISEASREAQRGGGGIGKAPLFHVHGFFASKPFKNKFKFEGSARGGAGVLGRDEHDGLSGAGRIKPGRYIPVMKTLKIGPLRLIIVHFKFSKGPGDRKGNLSRGGGENLRPDDGGAA